MSKYNISKLAFLCLPECPQVIAILWDLQEVLYSTVKNKDTYVPLDSLKGKRWKSRKTIPNRLLKGLKFTKPSIFNK